MPANTCIPIPSLKMVAMLIPKCAHTSLRYGICEEVGWDIPLNWEYPLQFEYLSKEKVIYRYPEWKKFSFVRNPFDRLVSCYCQQIRPPREEMYGEAAVLRSKGIKTFEDLLSYLSRLTEKEISDLDQHIRPMTYHLTDDRGRLIPGFIGRLENLQEDWERLGFKSKLPWENKGDYRSHYRKFYDKKTRVLAEEFLKDDLKLFGYSF